jgi:probable rRNA maturation factor
MILNRQRTVRVARPALESFLRQVRETLGLDRWDVTVCLVSDAEIARMNESFRKKKGPTDVLSFPAVKRRKPIPLPVPVAAAFRGGRASTEQAMAPRVGRVTPDTSEFLGDIAISPATARRNAKKYGRPASSELQVLILHGVLHLLGYNHETDRGEMKRIERRLRRRFGLA